MIPPSSARGSLPAARKYFLPQLIASAETMQKAMEHLEPRLRDARAGRKRKGPILLATVQGDIHDIGKNIVALMLRNHGFQVVDLGRTWPGEGIARAIRRHKPPVVGSHALMTTTMVRMPGQ